MLSYLVLAGALLAGGLAAPTASKIKFNKSNGLPQVTFPDATYQASNYDSVTDVSNLLTILHVRS